MWSMSGDKLQPCASHTYSNRVRACAQAQAWDRNLGNKNLSPAERKQGTQKCKRGSASTQHHKERAAGCVTPTLQGARIWIHSSNAALSAIVGGALGPGGGGRLSAGPSCPTTLPVPPACNSP